MNKKDLELTKEVLCIIAEAQQDCARVKLTIGKTTESSMVVHGGVYIEDCPAHVVNKLIEAGFILEMSYGKLTYCYKKEVQ